MISELIKQAVSAATFGALRSLRRNATAGDVSRLRSEFGYGSRQLVDQYAPLLLSGERGMQAMASGDLSSLVDRVKSLSAVDAAGLRPKHPYDWPTDTTGDTWELLKKEIRNNKQVDDLKVNVLRPGDTGNLASASTFKALNHVNKDIGVKAIDAGCIINPNVFKKNVLGDRWPAKLREAGIERLYGTSSRKNVRNISLEASDLVLSNAKNGVHRWEELTPDVREKLIGGGIRDSADFAQLQQDARWVPRPNVTYDPRSGYGGAGFSRDLRKFDGRTPPPVEWTSVAPVRNALDAAQEKHGERINQTVAALRGAGPPIARGINQTAAHLRDALGPLAERGVHQARSVFDRWRGGA
jgi:hypothetical protein